MSCCFTNRKSDQNVLTNFVREKKYLNSQSITHRSKKFINNKKKTLHNNIIPHTQSNNQYVKHVLFMDWPSFLQKCELGTSIIQKREKYGTTGNLPRHGCTPKLKGQAKRTLIIKHTSLELQR